jgi:hypothetical protein
MPFHANPVFVMTRSINLTPGEVLMKGAAVFLVRVVLLTIALFVTFVGVLATSSRTCHTLRQESCELAFESLCDPGAPALGDGLGRGVGEDLLFAFFQSIEDACSRRFGRDFRYVEAAVHVGVDRKNHVIGCGSYDRSTHLGPHGTARGCCFACGRRIVTGEPILPVIALRK